MICFSYAGLFIHRARVMSKRTELFLIFLICSVVVYELPYLMTFRETGWSSLPPVVDYPSDQVLYISLSAIQHSSATEVVNPWYGVTTPTADVAHLRFPVTFLLFRVIHYFFRSWTTAMLVWAGLWAGLSFATAVFCLRSFFPDGDRRLISIGGFGLIVLQLPLIYIAEVRQLPSLAGFYQLWLPYVRFAFPQIIVPAVLAYLCVQACALRTGSKWALAGMVLLQFFTALTFPYFPVLVLGTVLAVLMAKVGRKELGLSWGPALAFIVICGVADAGYSLLRGLGASRGNFQIVFQFRPEMLRASFRPYVVFLAAAACVALVSRCSFATRATVAGLAFANVLFAFSGVFLAPTVMMTVHVNYLVALTSWLPIFVIVWQWVERFNGRLLRVALASILLGIGVWEAYAGYRVSLPLNTLQASAIKEVERLNLKANDLVLAPAQFSDDISCWIPLLSPARVLYTQDAQDVSPDSMRGEQNFRQAVYLETIGVGHAALLSLTAPGVPEWRMNPIALFGEMPILWSPLSSDRTGVKEMVRERLGGTLAQLEAEPSSANYLFRGYGRVIVMDGSREPLFQPSAFTQWLEIEQAYERDGVRVWICRPKTA